MAGNRAVAAQTNEILAPKFSFNRFGTARKNPGSTSSLSHPDLSLCFFSVLFPPFSFSLSQKICFLCFPTKTRTQNTPFLFCSSFILIRFFKVQTFHLSLSLSLSLYLTNQKQTLFSYSPSASRISSSLVLILT